MTTHDVLVRAKAYLLTHGWLRVAYGGDGGPACMVGALQSVGTHDTETFVAARAALQAGTGSPLAVFAWNDQRGRTFAEVIDAFDRAIVATAPVDAPTPEPVTA